MTFHAKQRAASRPKRRPPRGGGVRVVVPRVASALILYLLATVLSIVWLNELGDTVVWVALIPQALGCLALGWWIQRVGMDGRRPCVPAHGSGGTIWKR